MEVVRISLLIAGMFAEQELTLVVDHCSVAHVEENIDSSTEDRTPCARSGMMMGDMFLFNMHTPLELGGRSQVGVNYPTGLTETPFNGCIKNLMYNGMVSQHFDSTSLCFILHGADGFSSSGVRHEACEQNTVQRGN